jgi:SAM-dependent methyltransferase/catechol 2,3-dioxygenase-like lactoylglutathione lyase family enzyme
MAETTKTTDATMPRLLAAMPQALVTDVTRAAAYYGATLGFRTVYLYGSPPFYGLVERDGAAINLRHVDDPDVHCARAAESVLAANIPVAGVSALHAEFAGRGAEFAQALKQQPWGTTDFVVRDPDGNLLCFAEAAGAAPTPEQQVAKIFAWRRGFNALHTIDLGLALGLFKAWAASPGATAGEIAATLGLHAPYVETWCTTAYSFGLIDGGEDRRFRLAPHMDQVLADPGHPRYLGGYVRLGTVFGSEDFARAPELFRSGGTVPFQGRSPDFAETIAAGTWGLQVLSAKKLLPGLQGLKAALDGGGALLEIGYGTGRHLILAAKTFARARLTGIDIDPTGRTLAEAAIAAAGVADRVSIVTGDVGEAVPAASFDAVVMIEVLHEIAPRWRAGVVAGCHRALKPGGWLLIVDETYPETLAESRRPEFLFPVQTGIEELTWGNVLPTKSEQEGLLRGAGFAGPIERSLIGEGFTVLAVRK